MKKNTYKIATISVAVVLASVGISREWKKQSDPSLLDSSFNHHFDALPLKGQLQEEKEPWSDSTWPNFKGGISAAPFSENTPPFQPVLLTRDELFQNTWGKDRGEKSGQRLTEKDLRAISPAEKFDLYRGRYDYPLTRLVLKSTSPQQPKWTGLSHGWAAASINHAEPARISVANADGVLLPFTSSDVKGLMSYYYGTYAYNKRQVKQLGERCKIGLLGLGKCSQDVNAGALHIVLANQIGLKERGFIVDRALSGEILNQPVVAYDSEILDRRTALRDSKNDAGQKMAKRSSSEVLLRTVIYLAAPIEPTLDAVIGTSRQKLQTLTYLYWLELDENQKIIGGRYENESELPPDFLWTVQAMKFDGDFSALNEIYTPAALKYVESK
jgi:hypothetical protein